MNTDAVKDFRRLRVYASAFRVAMDLFTASDDWPAREKYALTDQIRRSSRSVCACIGEAWFKRRYPKHFISKLSDAASEAAETLVWIDFAVACGYLSAGDAERLAGACRNVIGGLTKMAAQPEKWCLSPAARTINEDTPAYDAACLSEPE